MRIGVTATRRGLTEAQRVVWGQMCRIFDEVDCGDCVGGDADAFHVLREANPSAKTIGRPGLNRSMRAFCSYDIEHQPKEYHVRNRDIVTDKDEVVAFPWNERGSLGAGGTWYTIRYALKIGVPVTIVRPSGRLESIGGG